MPSQEEGAYHPSPEQKIKVRVGIAPRMQPFDESMESLQSAVSVAMAAGFQVTVEKVRRGCPGFQNAGPLFAHFIEAEETHMFFAGDDVIYPPDAIVRLVNDGKDVVSGIYRKNLLPSIEPANNADSAEKFMEYFRTGGVYETGFAACHSMTVRRGVVEKMIADYPELHYEDAASGETHYGLFLPMIKDRKCFQDDWSFSIRAKQSGFRIWDDFGVRLKHFCGDFLGFEALEVNHAG